METALQVRGLTKKFGAKTAVDEITFEVKKGDIMGLLGPNGAGKTTAIRMIMGILQPDRGEVTFYFNGKAASVDKACIGYLPEERGLYDDAGVLDNLIYLADLKKTSRKEARRKALERLEKVELADYAGQKLEKLSKGMQQKVQFIATILHEPEVVMLDEPFSGLDPINQDLFKDYIKELRQNGTTILLSAHQMNLVEELCETIFMINQGKQVLYGPLTKIKKEHREYLVHIRHAPGQDLSFLTGSPEVTVVREEGDRLNLRYSGSKPVSELVNSISSRINLEEININKPPLHDLFVQTVRKKGENIEGPAFI